MKKQFYYIALLLLMLLVIAGCGSTGGQEGEDASLDELGEELAGIEIPSDALGASWPDSVPEELPEYTDGTVTASGDTGGSLTIKVADTSRDALDGYLEDLRSAGWIVTASSRESEAVLGLHEVRFALQGGDDTVLQIDVYTQEGGDWPADQIPPDVPEPKQGVLVGKVEVLSSVEDIWYFDYTYDGVDEAAARDYMNSLAKAGWSGDEYQMYKSFEWKGKSYEATIEIYETVETRTTFTCNFWIEG